MDDSPSSYHPLQVAWLEETSVSGKVLEGVEGDKFEGLKVSSRRLSREEDEKGRSSPRAQTGLRGGTWPSTFLGADGREILFRGKQNVSRVQVEVGVLGVRRSPAPSETLTVAPENEFRSASAQKSWEMGKGNAHWSSMRNGLRLRSWAVPIERRTTAPAPSA